MHSKIDATKILTNHAPYTQRIRMLTTMEIIKDVSVLQDTPVSELKQMSVHDFLGEVSQCLNKLEK